MSVTFQKEKEIFYLHTKNSTYLIGITPEGYIDHIYYGRRLYEEADSYLLRTADGERTFVSFS